MSVDLENFRLGQSWVRRDGVGTPHPNPQHPLHPKTIQIESKYCLQHILWVWKLLEYSNIKIKEENAS